MSNEPMVGKEAHKIRIIENAICKLANDVNDALAKAREINNFFFGVPEDESKTASDEPQITAGWFSQHIDVISKIDNNVMDINIALANIREVTDKK